MFYINRTEAIQLAGRKSVEELESLNCEPSNRVTGDGTVEFTSTVDFKDDDGIYSTLTAFYYQNEDDLNCTEDLSTLDWEIYGVQAS